MSNQVQSLDGQEITQSNEKPLDAIRGLLVKEKSKFENVLPAHISFEKFQSVIMTAIITNPNLLQAHRPSLLTSCVKAATDGLLPDGRDAALVIFNAKSGHKLPNGKDEYIQKVQYMPMYAGILKKVRQSNEISSIVTHVVYEKDVFEYLLGDEEKIVHVPYLGGDDRGEIKAAYCIAKLKDGTTVREVMSRADIEKVRKTSKSGDKDGKPIGIWFSWYEEMARKTVFRRAAKWLPQSIDKEGNPIRPFDNDETLGELGNYDESASFEKDDIPAIEGQATNVSEQPDLKKQIAQAKEEAKAEQMTLDQAARILGAVSITKSDFPADDGIYVLKDEHDGELRLTEKVIFERAAEALAKQGKQGSLI